jgi:diacylglycerol kinase family enzyme
MELSPPASAFLVVLNSSSGQKDSQRASHTIAEVLNAAGRDHEILHVDDPRQLPVVARRAVAKARERRAIVVAAGGDGTLNAVAQATLGSGCDFGVIPRGTFNYFARAHGISQDTAEATRSLLTARVELVPVGVVNDRVFLVNASLGLYPESLELREQQKRRHGRRRSVAAWAALLTVLRGYRPLRIRLATDGGLHDLRTLTLFVGVNRLQLEQMGLDANAAERGRLAAFVLRPISTGKLLWLLVRGALFGLEQARDVESFSSTTLSVSPSHTRTRGLKVATDGEIRWMDAPFEFRIADEPLRLLKPLEPDADAARR